MNTAPNIDVCPSINTKANRAAITSPLQQLHDPVNHLAPYDSSSNDEEYFKPNNVAETRPAQSDYAVHLLTTGSLYLNLLP
jgi:hypothetical protein